MKTSLYACLHVPDFAVAVLTRAERNLRERPAAVWHGKKPHAALYGVNRAARAAGLREQMPLPEALARFAAASPREKLDLHERSPEQEWTAQHELLDLGLTLSPLVEDTAPGTVLLDLAGLPDPYEAARRFWAGAAKLALEGNVAVSQNRFVATCAARIQPGVTHLYPGQEAGFLSVQPLDVLPLSDAERATFARWGIHTVGKLAELPENAMVERFGPRGAALVRLARGEERTAFRPYQPALPFEETLDLDWEIAELESLAFLLAGLLDKLCWKLHGAGQAAEALAVSLKLAGGGRFERSIPLSYPLADPQVLLTLVRLDLAASSPGDAVTGIRIGARPAPRRMLQYSLFEPALPSPEKLAVTLSRLTNLLGKDHVGAPVVVDTHRPGAFALAVFAPQQETGARQPVEETPRIRQVLSFRHFRPMPEAEVLLATAAPVHLHSTEISGPIENRSGPWRVCGDWWTEAGWAFEEWDIAIRGRLYRIQCELPAIHWRLAGVYD